MRRLLPLLVLALGCGSSLKQITPAALPEPRVRADHGPPPKALQHYALAVISWQEGDRAGAQEHLGIALLFDPNAAWLHLAKGRLAIEQGDLAAARSALARAVTLEPRDPTPRRELARVLEIEGDYEAAVRQLETLLATTRDDRAFADLVQLLLMLDRRDEASGWLDRWAEQPPASRDDLQRRAAVALQLGRHDEAWQDLAQLVEGERTTGPALDLLLEAMKRSARVGSTIALLQRVATWEPGNEEVLVRLGGLARTANDPFLAIDAWSRVDLLRGGQDADMKQMQAQAWLDAGEPARALALAEQARALDPEAPLLLWTQARTLAALGRYDEALALIAATPERDEDGRVLRLEAEILERAGRAEDAHRVLEDAVALAPASWVVSWELAELEARTGALPQALARAEALPDPLRTEAEWQLALALLEHDAGALPQALQRLVTAEGRWPETAALPLARARWLEEAGQGDEARALLRDAHGRFPSDPAIGRELARLEHALGDATRARALLREALAHNPDQPDLLNDLAYLEAEAGRYDDAVLAMARRAVDQAPANAAYLDTLGWVLLGRGEGLEALATLERAARHRPDDPTILEHLRVARETARTGKTR